MTAASIGKTLSIYLALNPEDYKDTKYFFEDSSEVKKYEGTPFRMKIRSDRGVKWAIELIADMMAKLGREKVSEEMEMVDYTPEYEEQDPLIFRRWIKRVGPNAELYINPNGEFVDNDFDGEDDEDEDEDED